jgi:ubiquinone/menaquinone biosynthesis C-methylase UbiE
MTDHPPICDYEGSDYQASFWDHGNRAYEDQSEAVALHRLLPQSGRLMLEIGAGAGRNTPRYHGYDRVILMDYSLTQIQQAQERLGCSDRLIYVAADLYRLPFVDNLFDGATMIRVLHHISDPADALTQVRRVMKSDGVFILEFANKQNLKAIARYLLGRQDWNPFALDAVEFVPLNFDFHPRAVRQWLEDASFELQRQLTVSHFRIDFLKRWIPTKLLVALDSLAQLTGDWWQLTPSVFTKSTPVGPFMGINSLDDMIFRCPNCEHVLPNQTEGQLICSGCGRNWPIVDGIYDFRERRVTD